jgi:hypothetical protein
MRKFWRSLARTCGSPEAAVFVLVIFWGTVGLMTLVLFKSNFRELVSNLRHAAPTPQSGQTQTIGERAR